MSIEDQEVSELGSPVSIPRPNIPNIAGVKVTQFAPGSTRETRELKFRLKQANKTMGKQGQTIAGLRGELARLREEHSKIDRGELRRLERFEPAAKEIICEQVAEIGRLHEELEKAKGHVVTGQHAVDRAAAELEAQQ